jgi:glycerol-1-phosphate dehydrogenase [NAD(P)+]
MKTHRRGAPGVLGYVIGNPTVENRTQNMNHELLGKTFSCACGHVHAVPLEEIHYGDHAWAALPGLFRKHAPGRDRVLLADARTWTAAGQAIDRVMEHAGLPCRTLILPDPPHGDPVCDDHARAWLEENLPSSAGALLAVGSGVVNDLAKWAAYDRRLPYMVAATAASMNGYTSANIAPAIRGVKRVLDGHAPFAVAATPAVLAAAPWRLTSAGLGDVIAKPVSMTDWSVNRLLFDEYFCPLCAGLIRDLEPVYMNDPEGLARREPASLEALFMALLYSGLSMTLAGTSFPASGGEHMVSHVLDMKAMAEGRPHDYHGRQVGLGAIVAAALYERLLTLNRPVFKARTEPTDAAYWGALGPVVEEEHAAKRVRAVQAAARLNEPGVWETVLGIISAQAVSPARIKDCLRRAGAAHTLADIGCPRQDFVDALVHSHQIRARYTVLDLARAAGLLPEAAESLVDEWLIT